MKYFQIFMLIRIKLHSGLLRSGGATNNYTSGIVASLIDLGLAKKHLDMCRDKYRVTINQTI